MPITLDNRTGLRALDSGDWRTSLDLWWAFFSLLVLSLIINAGMGVEPHPRLAVYSLLWPSVVVAVLALLPTSRTRAAIVWLGIAAASALAWADLLYFRFFGDAVSAPVLLAAHQLPQLASSVRSLAEPWDLVLLVNLSAGAALVKVCAGARHSVTKTWLASARASLLGLAAATLTAAIAFPGTLDLDRRFSHRLVISEIGWIGYHAVDLSSFVTERLQRGSLTPDALDEVRQWFAARASSRAGEGRWFGGASAASVIVVQVESLQGFVTDLELDGAAVTPNLNRFRQDSISFTNVIDQTGDGRTSDAEFLALLSLLPSQRGAIAFQYPANRHVSVATVLQQHGYRTVSAVPFRADFWNRATTHPALGFQRTLYAEDFEPGPEIGWGLNDHDFLMQMVDRISEIPRPFLGWLITLSLHYPFEGFPDDLRTLPENPYGHTAFGNYLEAMRFFDTAFGAFLSALEDAGRLDDTLIVVFGDHDAGFGWEPALSGPMGSREDPASWTLVDRIPLMIRLPGRPDLATEVSTVAGLVDLAPTLLALLGVDPEPLPFMGRNLLGRPDDGPVPRPNAEWVDEQHVAVSMPALGDGAACYDRVTGAPSDASACRAAGAAAHEQRRISELVFQHDLQQRLAGDVLSPLGKELQTEARTRQDDGASMRGARADGAAATPDPSREATHQN